MARVRTINVLLMMKNKFLSIIRGICRIRENNHTSEEQISKRASVNSPVLYEKVYFMARYLSPLIKARWKREVSHRTLVKNWVTFCSVHVLVVASPRTIVIINAVNMGCTITPTIKSVVAKHASSAYDLLALIRDFVLMAIITKTFKAAVKGNVTMLITARKIRRALTSAAEDGSTPPSKI